MSRSRSNWDALLGGHHLVEELARLLAGQLGGLDRAHLARTRSIGGAPVEMCRSEAPCSLTILKIASMRANSSSPGVAAYHCE